MSLESAQTPDYGKKFTELEGDPVAGPILQEEALRVLKYEHADYFDREFSGEIDADGYLIRKDGTNSNTLPSQNLTTGLETVVRRVEARLRAESKYDSSGIAEQEGVVERQGWGSADIPPQVMEHIRSTGAFDEVNLHAIEAVPNGGDVRVIRQLLAPVLARIDALRTIDPFLPDRVTKEMVKMALGKRAEKHPEMASAVVKVINGQDVPVPGASGTDAPYSVERA